MLEVRERKREDKNPGTGMVAGRQTGGTVRWACSQVGMQAGGLA